MSETLEKTESSEEEARRVKEQFRERTLLRLEAMCENFESGSWTTATKKSLVSNAFNIKNDSIALNYSLLAKTAESFCNYADMIKYPTENQRIVMAKHLEAMQSVALHDVKAGGGAIGQELFAHLQLLIKKFQE